LRKDLALRQSLDSAKIKVTLKKRNLAKRIARRKMRKILMISRSLKSRIRSEKKLRERELKLTERMRD